MLFANRPRWSERIRHLDARVIGRDPEVAIGRALVLLVAIEAVRFGIGIALAVWDAVHSLRALVGWL